MTHHEPTGRTRRLHVRHRRCASAIEQAKQAAGDKVVGLHGATVMQQALPLGLVDEIRVHVIPVLLGGGTPLFGTLDSAITLERTRRWRPRPRRTWDSAWCAKTTLTSTGVAPATIVARAVGQPR